MIEQLKDDEVLCKYYPDEFMKGRIPDRDFFFNVLNTVYPGYLGNLIEHANKVRNKKVNDEGKPQTILSTDQWINELSAV